MKDSMCLEKNCIIVSGGHVELSILDEFMKKTPGPVSVIAVDRGMESCKKLNIVPDFIIGDYDSADEDIVEYYRRIAARDRSLKFVKLMVHKDLTDTHAAMVSAMDMGASTLYILGATGTRLDHTMANIGLLEICVNRSVESYIVDRNNVITMINKGGDIRKIDGYDYISFIPYGGDVKNVTLMGFEYETQSRDFCMGDSLGVSNRIVSEKAHIEFENGYMIVNYSRD
jgi:thiamine pyrophosphokinase